MEIVAVYFTVKTNSLRFSHVSVELEHVVPHLSDALEMFPA